MKLSASGELLNVLVIDDDEDDFLILRDLLEDCYGNIVQASHLQDPADLDPEVHLKNASICFIDYNLGQKSGTKTIAELRAKYPHIPCILLTGVEDSAVDLEASDSGAHDYIPKRALSSELLERSIRYSLRIAEDRKNHLIAQQRDFEQIMSDVGCAVWRIRLSDGALLRYSGATESILGVKLGDRLGEDLFAIPGFESSAAPLHRLKATLKKGDSAEERVLFCASANKPICLHIRAKPDGDTAEGIMLDVTAQYRLEESQRYFQQAFDQTEDAIMITDSDLTDSGPSLVYVNAAMLAMTGFSQEELAANLPAFLKGHDSDDHERERLAKCLHDKTRFTGEFVNYSKFGTAYRANFSLNPVRNECGEVTHFLCIQRDVTRRRAMEAEVTEGRKHLQKVIEHAPFPIMLFAEDGQIIMMSQAWSACSGYPREQLKLVGDWIYRAFPNDAEIRNLDLRDLFDGKWEGNGALPIRDAAGKDRLWQFDSVMIGKDSNSRRLMVTMAADITDLHEALDRAESANKAKSDFLAVMSHELRTPLNPIIGLTEILMEETDDTEQSDMLGMIDTSAKHLLRLIEDILDFTQTTGGKLTVESKTFSLEALVKECYDTMVPAFVAKGLTLTVDWNPFPSVLQNKSFVGDPGRIRQVLLNLVDNAAKFTREGGATIRIRSESATEDSEAVVAFDVADTGPGIESEEKEKIFDGFYQSDNTSTRAQGGTGLGLSICANLAANMRGTIEVASTPESGSTFTFSLPLNLADRPPGSQTSAPRSLKTQTAAQRSRRGGTVLVVEDDPWNMKYLRNCIRREGFDVEEARDGNEAIEIFKAISHRISLILMDVRMPNCNGIEASQTIRTLENGGASVPVVAVTANVGPEDREECLKAGMNDFLPKPFRPQDIHRILEKWAAETQCPPGEKSENIRGAL